MKASHENNSLGVFVALCRHRGLCQLAAASPPRALRSDSRIFMQCGAHFLLCWVSLNMAPKPSPSGMISRLYILSICFFVLWGLTHFISGTPARLEASKGFATRPFPRGVVIALGAWLLVTVLSAEIWYRCTKRGKHSVGLSNFRAQKTTFPMWIRTPARTAALSTSACIGAKENGTNSIFIARSHSTI
jgi:hypothetical protein